MATRQKSSTKDTVFAARRGASTEDTVACRSAGYDIAGPQASTQELHGVQNSAEIRRAQDPTRSVSATILGTECFLRRANMGNITGKRM